MDEQRRRAGARPRALDAQAGDAAGDEPPVAERVAEREAGGADGVAAQHEEDRAPPALPPLARVRRSPRRQRLASGTHHLFCFVVSPRVL